jgi:hypothetical protein
MFRFLFNLMKTAAVVLFGTALVAKFVLESNAEPSTQEIDLIAIYGGQHLVSEAEPFYGGKVIAMCGGVLLDLRRVTPAPTGMFIDLAVVMGGVSLVVPEGWRVKFKGKVMLGGWSDNTRTTADQDVPTVDLGGFVVMGGVQATTKSPVEVSV